MNNPVRFEPVLVIAGFLGSIASALTGVVFAFVHVTDGQQAAVTAAVGVLVSVGTALLARGRVTPTAALDELAALPQPASAKRAGKAR